MASCRQASGSYWPGPADGTFWPVGAACVIVFNLSDRERIAPSFANLFAKGGAVTLSLPQDILAYAYDYSAISCRTGEPGGYSVTAC